MKSKTFILKDTARVGRMGAIVEIYHIARPG